MVNKIQAKHDSYGACHLYICRLFFGISAFLSLRKPESKVALTVSIFDHCVNSVTCFKYLGILILSDFTWTNHVEYMAGKINQRLGLLRRIKHLLPFRARILFYKSLVMPLFEYADLVWGDKHNVTLMSSASLQVLQNKAAKVILDRPLYLLICRRRMH